MISLTRSEDDTLLFDKSTIGSDMKSSKTQGLD